jgi:class 3 adenylate cyclase
MDTQILSVGFADLSHYDRAVTQLGSAAALALLDEAFRAAGDAILRRGGQLRKYIGDAILFTFADPSQAVQAAHEIAGFRRAAGPLTLRYHVGVATGEVLVGEIGHPARRVEDVMGVTVNLAARLVKLAYRSESGVALCPETERLGAPRPDLGALLRQAIQTAAPWEPIVGYSRAVRVGPFIAVTGTTALDEAGQLVGAGDPAAQTRQCLRNIAAALARLHASLDDVVRTRIYVTDIGQWEAIGRVHGEVFGAIRPATTMVQVAALIDPRMLVEIEADAILGGRA